MILDLVLRWMHILSAVVLVGGTVFQWVAWAPANDDAKESETAAGVRSRWSKLVMAASGFLLISGLINLVLILNRFEIPKDSFPASVYHPVFGMKFLLAFGVFFLSSVLSGRSALAERFRAKEKMWLTINMSLAVIVVCLAGILKLADRAPKATGSSRSERSSVLSPARLGYATLEIDRVCCITGPIRELHGAATHG